MAQGWWLVAALVVAAALEGCAGGAASPGPGLGPERAPEPLYRRSFTTPAGREWEFRIGGDVSER